MDASDLTAAQASDTVPARATDILSSIETGNDQDEELTVWLDLPHGYLPLPVRDGAERLGEAEPVLTELCPPERLPLLYATLETFAELLAGLEERGALYCGLGWHEAPDGTLVSSTLVVTLQWMGEPRNPRLVLGDLVTAAAEAGEKAQADLVDLPGGPALFFERTRELGRPRLPGQQGDPGRAEVYQLEAVVPQEKGEWIAALEFSTPQTGYGMLFREMMVLLASSVSFTAPPGSDGENASSRNIRDLLGGAGL
jgi:hypothetical protein